MLTAVVQAGNRIRTGDLNLGKVALYQLSYACMSSSANLAGPAMRRSRREATLSTRQRANYQLSYACVSLSVYPGGPAMLRSRREATLSKRSLRTTS